MTRTTWGAMVTQVLIYMLLLKNLFIGMAIQGDRGSNQIGWNAGCWNGGSGMSVLLVAPECIFVCALIVDARLLIRL